MRARQKEVSCAHGHISNYAIVGFLIALIGTLVIAHFAFTTPDTGTKVSFQVIDNHPEAIEFYSRAAAELNDYLKSRGFRPVPDPPEELSHLASFQTPEWDVTWYRSEDRFWNRILIAVHLRKSEDGAGGIDIRVSWWLRGYPGQKKVMSSDAEELSAELKAWMFQYLEDHPGDGWKPAP